MQGSPAGLGGHQYACCSSFVCLGSVIRLIGHIAPQAVPEPRIAHCSDSAVLVEDDESGIESRNGTDGGVLQRPRLYRIASSQGFHGRVLDKKLPGLTATLYIGDGNVLALDGEDIAVGCLSKDVGEFVDLTDRRANTGHAQPAIYLYCPGGGRKRSAGLSPA